MTEREPDARDRETERGPDARDRGTERQPKSRDRRADLAILGVVVIWAANFSVVKAALVYFDPLAFNSLRFVLASACLWAAVQWSRPAPARAGSAAASQAGSAAASQAGGAAASIGRERIDRRDMPTLIGLGILGNVVYQVLFIYGLDWTLAGNASLMLATVPMFAGLMSVRLGHERLGQGAWAGIVASILGIVLVVLGGAQAVGFGAATVRGDLLMLAAAVAWSAYTVGASPLVRRYGALRVTAITMWIGTAGLVLLSAPALVGQAWHAVRPAAWLALLYSGVLAIALAYLLWYYSVGRIGSSRTAIYSNTIPLVAIAIAWPALGEVPGWLQVVGTVFILGGITLARKARVEPTGARSLPPE